MTRRTDQGGAAEHEVLFVGESARLQEHFINHPKVECFSRHNADCVGVHRKEDEAARRETVSELIAQLRPPCND